MKSFMRKIAAASAALIISVSAIGTAVSADDKKELQGWVLTEKGWVYIMTDGNEAVDRLLKIDGILYEFDEKWKHEFKKYTGWVKFSAGQVRRFSHGLPYTGWLKYDDGKLCYCLDGYMIKEKTQIGDGIFSFDDYGIYQKETKLTIVAECQEEISSDAEKISITLKSLDGGKYSVKAPDTMERWEHGRWVDCKGRRKLSNKKQTGKKTYIIENKSDTVELGFDPQNYTKNGFDEGYYRIPIESVVSGKKYTCYAMFRVVPPVEVNTSENMYFDSGNGVKVDFNAEIKSDKYDISGSDFEAHIFKKTTDGWKDITEHTYADGTVSTEVVPVNEVKDGMASYGMLVNDGTGYYKAVIQNKSENKEYADYFRIERLEATPWLDTYSTKAERLVVFFNVKNNTSYTVFFRNDALTLYKKENDEWIELTDNRKAVEESSEVIEARQKTIVLEPGYKTNASVNISDYYDVSALEAGEYAVYFSGIGYQSFLLTTEELPDVNYPYKDISESEIESLVLEVSDGGGSEFLTVDEQDMEYVLDCLRQFYIGKEHRYSSIADIPAGGGFGVKITFKDGREDLFRFIDTGIIIMEEKYYVCGKYLGGILNDLIIERLDLDKKYYGYRNTF